MMTSTTVRALREDTHEEQERLYPETLQQRSAWHNSVYLPTRAEWADPEKVRYDVRTQCMTYERVPREPENYLPPAELDELATLRRDMCHEARPKLTAEIKRLRALLSSQPGAGTRKRTAWYLALDDVDRAIAEQLSMLEIDRRDLGCILRDGGPNPCSNPLTSDYMAGFVSQDKLRRTAELLAKLDATRLAAGQAAEDAAIATQQKRRLTDEGWAQQLLNRESHERWLTDGPLVRRVPPYI